MGSKHPIIFPTLRCRPARVSGIPILRDNFPFAADRPIARFQEKEKPYLRISYLLTSAVRAVTIYFLSGVGAAILFSSLFANFGFSAARMLYCSVANCGSSKDKYVIPSS